ncbi:MAG: methyltransferase domain-containing protein [Candidatus Bathyarchaeia archaeon]
MNVVARKRVVQEYYSRRARDYDGQKIRTWKSRQGFGDEVFRGLINSLEGLKGKRVLEVCVGTGRTSLPLLEKVKPWLVGLDLSREMLKVAEAKMSAFKDMSSLIMGDAEHVPFKSGVFDALICTSAMHYFAYPERLLAEFSRSLRKNGVLVFGDLTLHELDNRGFLNRLEKTVSRVHESYSKPSEVKRMLEGSGFEVSFADTVVYSKRFDCLIKDKARYFGVKPEAVSECVEAASLDERKLYSIGSDELTLFYTLIKAVKKDGH